MRFVALTFIAMFGLIAAPATVPASPIIPSDALAAAEAVAAPEILQIRDGCGRGLYLQRWQDRWGRWHRRCVPYRGWGHRPPWGPRGGYYR